MVFAREEELKAFEPAPRETVADQTGDMHSLARKLDRVVYLLVKKSREEHAWQMPQGGLEPDESLLEVSVLIERGQNNFWSGVSPKPSEQQAHVSLDTSINKWIRASVQFNPHHHLLSYTRFQVFSETNLYFVCLNMAKLIVEYKLQLVVG